MSKRESEDRHLAVAANGDDMLAHVDALESELRRIHTQLDGVLCALGLTALPDWEAAFTRLFSLLRPRGRFVLFDAFAAAKTFETRSVELVARAELSREVWRPLEAQCADFQRTVLPADVKKFGGELFVASGTKSVHVTSP